jgi:hypothetical protein
LIECADANKTTFLAGKPGEDHDRQDEVRAVPASRPLEELARLWRAIRHHRFASLLASLILMFFATAVVYLFRDPQHWLLGGVSVALLFDLMLLSAVNAVCETRKTMILALSIAAPAALFMLISAVARTTPVLVINNVLSTAFITLVIILVLGYLFRTDHVDANMICASLCVYLLIGVAWSSLYSLCEVAYPSSFVYPYAEEYARGSMTFGAEKSLIPIYYSFVTLTTLGYGDMVPLSPPAKILAILEAIIGQFYLTVLVARLVGLHIARTTSRSRSESS